MIEIEIIADALQGNLDKYINANVRGFKKFKKEWEWILKFHEKYGQPTTDTFSKEFPAFKIPDEINPTSYLIEKIDAKYKFDIIAPSTNKLIDDLQAGRVTEGVEEFIKKVQSVSGANKDNVENVFKTIDRRLEEYEKKLSHPEHRITTGFEELDKVLGGFGKSDLVIIAGRAGEGKSLTAIKSAYESSRAKWRVAYFNGEMENDEIGYRVDTIITGLSNFSLSQGLGGVAENYRGVAPTIKDIKSEFLLLQKDKEPITPQYLERFCRNNNIDILYIDQFSLLDNNYKYKSDSENAYELVRDLKQMQKALNIPVILLAQIKRQDKTAKRDEGEPKYDLSDLGRSRALEEFASKVIMLDNVREDNQTLIHMFIGKNRGGEKGNTLTYHADIDKGEWTFVQSTHPLKKEQVKEEPKQATLETYTGMDKSPFDEDDDVF